MGSNASKRAAREQARAMQQAVDFQKGVYSDAQGNLNPYIQSGQNNLSEYQNRLDNQTQPTLGYTQEDFNFDKFSDPGAQYQAQQAAQAQQASALAKGVMGGGFAKALQTNQNNLANTAYSSAYDRWLKNSQLRYGQASDQYTRDNTFQQGTLDRYGNLAKQGMDASTALLGGGNSAASNLSSLYSGIGSANAAGTVGSANSWMNALNGGISTLSSGLGQLRGYGNTGSSYMGDYSTNNPFRMGVA
jgi:X-X-X-Leu-X-X-Gly heptad repeat protein